jgi:guanine deaminase
MTHHDHLRRALELAADHSSDGKHGPFGAVVVKGDEVVGEGWNQVVAGADPTAHAEIMAIRDACRRLGTHDLSGASIYCSCEPCPMCLSAIYWARISTVFFAASGEDAAQAGFDDSVILRELKRGWVERKIDGNQALREEGLRVLQAWTENPKKQEY